MSRLVSVSWTNCCASVARRRNVNDVVLDASALCALLFKEKGMDRVAKLLDGAFISWINLSETAAKAIEYGTSLEQAISTLDAFPLRVVPFDREVAYLAASLR